MHWNAHLERAAGLTALEQHPWAATDLNNQASVPCPSNT